MQFPVVATPNVPAADVIHVFTAVPENWDVDLRFNLVTHKPSKVSVAVDDEQNCTPLYVGEPLPAELLAIVCNCALDVWRSARNQRSAAA
jgi:hypothetical protein